MKEEFRLSTTAGSSRIIITDEAPELREFSDRPIVVTDESLLRPLAQFLTPFDVIAVPPGELGKDLRVVEHLYQEFFRRDVQRQTVLFGVGGGALLDLFGFATATYLRGVRSVYVPSTLLAQADAAIGGKNGVNFSGVKNLVGTTRLPEVVISSSALLRTLPASELFQGYAEIIKHGCLEAAELLTELENASDPQSPELLARLVAASARIKAAIVEQDVDDTGPRRKLNFGHTVGHALEVSLRLPHGSAVSIGMMIELRLSRARSLVTDADTNQLESILRRYQLPTEARYDAEALLALIRKDKKRSAGTVAMTLLQGLGRSAIEEVSLEEIRQVL